MKNKLTAVISIALLLGSVPLLARQEDPNTIEPSTQAELPEWLDDLRVSGMVRFRPQFESNYDFDKTNDDVHEYVGSKLWLGIEENFGEDVTAKIMLQDTRSGADSPVPIRR